MFKENKDFLALKQDCFPVLSHLFKIYKGEGKYSSENTHFLFGKMINININNVIKEFYIHGSVHRESNLIIIQQDATYSVYYISVGSSTCFRC